MASIWQSLLQDIIMNTVQCKLTDISCPSSSRYLNPAACILLNSSLCPTLSTNDVLVENLWDVHSEEEPSPSGMLHPLQFLG